MEALTGNNLIVTALVLVAVMEFVNLVGRTVGTFREWRKPGHDSDEDFQKRLLKCETRLEKDFTQLQDMKKRPERNLLWGTGLAEPRLAQWQQRRDEGGFRQHQQMACRPELRRVCIV